MPKLRTRVRKQSIYTDTRIFFADEHTRPGTLTAEKTELQDVAVNHWPISDADLSTPRLGVAALLISRNSWKMDVVIAISRRTRDVLARYPHSFESVLDTQGSNSLSGADTADAGANETLTVEDFIAHLAARSIKIKVDAICKVSSMCKPVNGVLPSLGWRPKLFANFIKHKFERHDGAPEVLTHIGYISPEASGGSPSLSETGPMAGSQSGSDAGRDAEIEAGSKEKCKAESKGECEAESEAESEAGSERTPRVSPVPEVERGALARSVCEAVQLHLVQRVKEGVRDSLS